MHARRWFAPLAVMAAALLAGGVALAAIPGSASASVSAVASKVLPARSAVVLAPGTSAVNPLTLAGGYTVYAQGNATLGNSEFEGSIAVGERLRLTHSATYQFAHVIAGTGSYVLPTVDGDPTRVLIGDYASDPANNQGRVQITSLGATEPSQVGDLKIVDRAAPFVSFTRGDWLRYARTAGTDDPPLIDAQNQDYPDDANPPGTSAGDGSIFTYETGADSRAIVADYVQASADANQDEIDECFANVVDPTQLVGHPVEILEDAGDRIVLGPLSPDQPNVLQYADIEGASLLQFSDGTPGPLNPLVIHVAAGTTTIMPPAIDPEGTYSPYTVWDLSEVTGAVTISTGGRGDGSIYAPDANVTISAQPWDGQIIANDVTILGGEVHSYLFAGALPCDTPVEEGTFSVAKELSGVAPGDVAPGTTFQVRYVALAPDGTRSTGVLELSPDGTPASPDVQFPFGTRIALFEVPPDDDVLPPDLAWTDVTWDGDTTFVIDGTHPTTELVVTDTAAPIPAGFSVSKQLTGSGDTAVPSGAEFTLSYTVNGGDPIGLTVSPDDPAVVADLEAGDAVTIGEIEFPEVEGITWGTPVWTVDGVPVEPDANGDVTFTLVGGETIAVQLTNEADAVGWIAISKTVAGDGSSALPDGTMFPLIYTLDGGGEQTTEIPASEAITFPPLPAGTVVTVREGELPEIPGVEWGAPGWTVDGSPQVPDADGNITFVVMPGTTVSLSLTNTMDGFGSLSVVKTVTGPGSDLVPADTAFPIEYRISNGPIITTEVTAGVPVTRDGLPTGVPVSAREAAQPDVPGVVWGSPTWTVDGTVLQPDADGWVTFVPTTGTTVEIELENTATQPAPTPTPTPTPGPTPDSGLAESGFDGAQWSALAVGAMIAGASAMAAAGLVRRRTKGHRA
ncbi:choice-of-anchor A domain-containing protein [Agromyces sp. CF514]|uniref:collagen-binding domain-containing protein n=1 Tax=Agromyces sp. CF514 TaxID=1881031 RepID=UPI0008DF05B7|nr:collagen-binding domain-containing protein [Agromyces sp. CF514]SFR74986.1 choice-of-anchor A domain-containing protein [Agromyces sp. CF514]